MSSAITVRLPAPPPGAREAADAVVGTGAPEWDGPVLDAPCRVSLDGELVAILARLDPGPLAHVRRGLMGWPFDTTTYRAVGIKSKSRTFGYLARNSLLQRDGCRACQGSRLAPEAHSLIVGVAPELARLYAEAAPELAARDLQAAAEVISPDWRMDGTQWTSGVANQTTVLPYHYDRNNLEPVWSAMVVARRGIRGGLLHVPELGAAFRCRDGDVVMFPGWRYVHGVTPVRKVEPDAYRYSAVFYCVSRMALCGTPEAEMARAQAGRTNREADVRDAHERIPSAIARHDAKATP